MLTEEQELLVKLVVENEMNMSNLDPQLQTAIKKMLHGLAQRGTEIGTTAFGCDGALSIVTDGKLTRFTAFESGFMLGRMYEKRR